MVKNGNKKRNKNTKRAKGAYQSIDEGEEQPTFRKRRGQNNKVRYNNNDDVDTKFTNSLAADGLEIVYMSADGNCLFRSLSDQLFGDMGTHHSDVRDNVCDFMEKNKEEFQLFLVFEDEDDENQAEEDARDFEHYIQTMRQDGEWGGNLEIVAAARLYRYVELKIRKHMIDDFAPANFLFVPGIQ